MPSMAFSAETGNYAIRGIAGIRYITYRQALPARSPILLFSSVLRTLHLLPLLLLIIISPAYPLVTPVLLFNLALRTLHLLPILLLNIVTLSRTLP